MWEFVLSIPIPNWTGFCLGSAVTITLFAAWGTWLAAHQGEKPVDEDPRI